jgi:hypothetical protein
VTKLAALVLVAGALTAGGTAPVATSRPAVFGTLQQGSRLTANPGSWTADGAITFAYQWSRCDASGGRCSSIHGATRGSYTQVRGDVGHSLAVAVRAQTSGGSAVAYAPLAGLVAAASARFAAAAQPGLVGEAIVGRSLSVAAVRWTSAAPPAKYRWLRCNANGRRCSTIGGARSVSYGIAPADAGHVLIAVVSAPGLSVLSASSSLVRTAPGPSALARPAIGGTLRVGEKLTGNAGLWSGGGTISYAYQWYRCGALGGQCSTLRGATRNTYTQSVADTGHTLGLTVHATDSTGTTAAYSSLAGLVAPASAALVARGQPSFDGLVAVGQELRIGDVSYTAKPASVTYAWLRCTQAVRTCAPISGGDKAAYTVTKDDEGHALVVAVTAVAAGERRVTLSTAATVG